MKKEEFLELASKQFDELKKLKTEKSFYEYEKKFEKLWIDYGKETFEKSISDVPKDRREKKNSRVDSER